mmetsp:Transcript_15630/g.23630  ORF Transcript_15630/g.23630 Transcript_15630/m.23630 type:complete len:224 (-) Transcript_15630:965-1636(-)
MGALCIEMHLFHVVLLPTKETGIPFYVDHFSNRRFGTACCNILLADKKNTFSYGTLSNPGNQCGAFSLNIVVFSQEEIEGCYDPLLQISQEVVGTQWKTPFACKLSHHWHWKVLVIHAYLLFDREDVAASKQWHGTPTFHRERSNNGLFGSSSLADILGNASLKDGSNRASPNNESTCLHPSLLQMFRAFQWHLVFLATPEDSSFLLQDEGSILILYDESPVV